MSVLFVIYLLLIGKLVVDFFAAGSFHTKNLFSRVYSIELEFYSQ